MYKMPSKIDWNDQKTLTALGVPPVFDPSKDDPTTRQHGATHTRRAELDLVAAVDARVRDDRDPLAVLLAQEARDKDEYEEAERDVAATDHVRMVAAADRIKALAADRTQERRRAFRRHAEAAGQGELLAGAAAATPEPARAGEVVSIRWGKWDWQTHGFWMLGHSRPGVCVTTLDTRRALVPIYVPFARTSAEPQPCPRSHHARRQRPVAGDDRQTQLF